jgi:hypothetical protein
MIKVIPLGEIEKYGELELNVSSIPQLFAVLQRKYGTKFLQDYKEYEVKHILKRKGKNIEEEGALLFLDTHLLSIDLNSFDEYYLVPTFSGEVSWAVAAAAVAAIGATGATATVLTAVIFIAANLAISIALSAIVQLIVPTPEFSTDPSEAQTKRSSLFNGAINVWNQGGSVPLVFGKPFCGGVVISAGLYTEEITI